jgi:hypothetical protein
VFEEDEQTGKAYVYDLKEIPLLESGQFYNVQSDRRLRNVYRDDLLEPEDSKVTLRIVRNDVEKTRRRSRRECGIRHVSLRSGSGEEQQSRTTRHRQQAFLRSWCRVPIGRQGADT